MLRAYRSRELGAEYLERGDYPSCIEFYQDCVEFSLKSILALYGRKFRLLHDVSEEVVALVESESFSDPEFQEKTSVIVVGSRTLDS
jgi:HEPN domain-containing protein